MPPSEQLEHYLDEIEAPYMVRHHQRSMTALQLAETENIDPHEVAKEFREQQSKLTKRTRSIFPKVKRWANVTTIVSVPLAIAGLSSGASLVTLAAATAAGLGLLGKQYVEFLESKYRWVGFLQGIPGPCQEREAEGEDT